jgi:hypothetical protein
VAISIPGLPGPRCGHPMERRNFSGRSDPAPVCARPDRHERRGTKASLRHLSIYAYRNELARRQRNRGRWGR